MKKNLNLNKTPELKFYLSKLNNSLMKQIKKNMFKGLLDNI